MSRQWTISASSQGVEAVSLRQNAPPLRLKGPGNGKKWRSLAERELSAYFTGRLTRFSVRYDMDGLPPFTRAVLDLTAKIPYGQVRSYQWLARKLGKPKAARAVGNALARNPIPIIIPCHRVVRNDGVIGGFALGAGWKKRLLELEKKYVKSKASAIVGR